VTVSVSASLGVTIYPQDGGDGDMLIRHADQAMYVAKQAGKNRFHLFDVERDAAVKDLQDELNDIERALQNGEFVLHYQPKVQMRTGELLGVEALVRWQHPQRGLLQPGEFLPRILDSPLIVALGDFVLHLALTQIELWAQQGLQVAVSVNLSARQLQQEGFVSHLERLFQAHPTVPFARIEFEMLESSAVNDMALAQQVMQGCVQLGIRFSLDDFGTGYSSLTYLKVLPAEVIKIDQSFVRSMLQDASDKAIVQGVIGLAHAFHRKVVAEGVETESVGNLLLELGCDVAQGYGIARPMPADALTNWLSTWKPFASWRNSVKTDVQAVDSAGAATKNIAL
jgi:EAL domain-containing protein (putative c-di-GMP-specific phosphodiesterase class I)